LIKDNRHKAFLRIISRLSEITASYSKDELQEFADIAARDISWFEPVIHDLIRVADKSVSNVPDHLSMKHISRFRNYKERPTVQEEHLFDLLRSKELFVTNADLADFAKKILPNISNKRYDKMSRGYIASSIIEYIESHDPPKCELLKKTMKNALISMSKSPAKQEKKQSFFRQWESIVKGANF
jgi:hypothetical protein